MTNKYLKNFRLGGIYEDTKGREFVYLGRGSVIYPDYHIAEGYVYLYLSNREDWGMLKSRYFGADKPFILDHISVLKNRKRLVKDTNTDIQIVNSRIELTGKIYDKYIKGQHVWKLPFYSRLVINLFELQEE